ncbi:sensor histidine kinase [Paenibacillus sedimenti]|uniref:histidine kinase n=1 Tax=Paenibacillus sedimenti TaxID=2770274 RepID=A0A926KMR4_9BACL|nr:histidine kinase [Paenibacillus sedimenti]MBD0379641.1 hypothetical protein [Paenibacillus sedimenti]
MKKASYSALHFLFFAAAVCFVLFMYGLLNFMQPVKPADIVTLSPGEVQYQWNASAPKQGAWSSFPILPGSSDHGRLWLQIQLPERTWKDKRLLIYPSVPEISVHAGDKVSTYPTNPLGADPRYMIEWSAIPLDQADSDKTILLSIEQPAVPPYMIEVGEWSAVVEYFYKTDLKLFIGFMVMLFIGFVALGLFIAFRKERLYLILSLFAWCLSLGYLVRMNSKHLFYFSPELYYYLSKIGAIGWPIFALMFFENIVYARYRSWIRRMWQGYAILASAVMTIITLRPSTYLWFEEGSMAIIIQLISLAIVVALILSIRKQPENVEYAFFLFGYTVYFLDLAVGIGLSYQEGGIASSFALALSFTAIMLRRYWLTQKELQSLNTGLEQKVRERTEELEQTHKKLVVSMQESALVMSEMSALTERNRISQEMHDVVGHTLTASIVQLEAVKILMTRDLEKAMQKIGIAEELVRKGLNDIRGSVRMLKEEDWTASIGTLLQRVIHDTEYSAEVQIRAAIEEGREIGPIHKNVLYFALIEGLSNGIRHGKSKRFKVSLHYAEDEVRFRLSNAGLPYEGRGDYGFGLQTLKEKTVMLGGKLEVVPNPDEPGAVIDIRLPLT